MVSAYIKFNIFKLRLILIVLVTFVSFLHQYSSTILTYLISSVYSSFQTDKVNRTVTYCNTDFLFFSYSWLSDTSLFICGLSRPIVSLENCLDQSDLVFFSKTPPFAIFWLLVTDNLLSLLIPNNVHYVHLWTL